MRFLEFQLALFFAVPKQLNWESIVAELKSELNDDELGDVISSDRVLMLPLPPSAPQDVPRLIINPDSLKNKISISLTRVDFHFSAGVAEELNPSQLEDFKRFYTKALNALDRVDSLIYSRVGCVTRLFVSHPTPSKAISAALLNYADPAMKDCEVRVNVATTISGVNWNNSVKFQECLINADGAFGVLIEKDVNTIAEDILSLNSVDAVRVSDIGFELDQNPYVHRFSEALNGN